MTLYPYIPDFDSKLRKSMLGQPGFFNEAASHCLCKFYQIPELFFFKNLMWNIFHLDIVIIIKISSLFVTRFTVGPLIFGSVRTHFRSLVRILYFSNKYCFHSVCFVSSWCQDASDISSVH